MVEGITQSGFTQIISYFENKGNHLDDDGKHISKKEFENAMGKISEEADKFLRGIVYSSNGYAYLKSLQKEGWFNDGEVSLRDMYAARRGVGSENEEIADLGELKDIFDFTGKLGKDDPIFLYAKYKQLNTGALDGNVDALIRAKLAIAGEKAIERFKALHDFRSGAMDGGMDALIRAKLAIAGEKAIERFKALRGSNIGAGDGDTGVLIRAKLAIAGEKAIERFKALHDFRSGVMDGDTHTLIRRMLAARESFGVGGEDSDLLYYIGIGALIYFLAL